MDDQIASGLILLEAAVKFVGCRVRSMISHESILRVRWIPGLGPDEETEAEMNGARFVSTRPCQVALT